MLADAALAVVGIGQVNIISDHRDPPGDVDIPTADRRMETLITYREVDGPFVTAVIYMDVWGLREELYDAMVLADSGAILEFLAQVLNEALPGAQSSSFASCTPAPNTATSCPIATTVTSAPPTGLGVIFALFRRQLSA
jgi:hypothetical protein